MKSQRWKQKSILLEAALERPSERWDAYLNEHCEDDPSLRGEIAAILEAYEQAKGSPEGRAEAFDAFQVPPPDDAPDPLIGQTIDGYEIVEVLGRGGMGVVYKAHDLNLDRVVALKMIDPMLARDETFVQGLYTEARVLARIDSPYIVRVHALRQTDAGLFIVMEYIDGGTVTELMRTRVLFLPQVLAIIKQVLTALEHAHAKGIIHRDVKLNNIMLTRGGTVKVMDFGLALVYEAGGVATLLSSIAGTPHFMSPEQVLESAQLDHRSDLYSFGVAIYLMLTGHLPFEQEAGGFAIMRAIVEKEPPPPSRFNAALSESFVEAIMKALEKDPDRRYQSAAEMREAFEALQVLTEAETIVEPAAAFTPARPKRPRIWRAVGLGMVVLTSAVMAISQPWAANPDIPPVQVPVVDSLEGRRQEEPLQVFPDSQTTRLDSVVAAGLARAQDMMQSEHPNPDQAWPHVRRVLERDPENPEALRLQTDIATTFLRWGNYYSEHGDHSNARSFYRRSLQVQHSDEAERRLALSEQMPARDEVIPLPPRPLEHRREQLNKSP